MEETGLKLLAAGAEAPVIYLLGDEGAADALFDGTATLVCVPVRDWNCDLTPWPAPGLRPEQPFTGGADALLERLRTELIQAAEAKLGFVPRRRGIAGYSLAGLFALCALTRCELFSCAASVSGSLWYDGWTEDLEQHLPKAPGAVYLSVGSREKKARDPRMAQVENCTERTEELLRQAGLNVIFEKNPGGHFQDPEGRLRRALQWLTKNEF